MKQLEIEYFFPLTEQIPLDLDFSQCSPHLYYLKAQGHPREGPFATGMVYSNTTSAKVTIKADELTIHGLNMPWYRKILFKLIGIKYD